MKHRVWTCITVAAFLFGWGMGRGLPIWESPGSAEGAAPVAAGEAPGEPPSVSEAAGAGSQPGLPGQAVLQPASWNAALERLDVLARAGDRAATDALRLALLDSVMELARGGEVRLARDRLQAFLARNTHDPDAYLLHSDLLQMQGRARGALDPLLELLRFADDPEVVGRARDKLELLVNAREAHLANAGNVPALIRFLEDLTVRDPSFDGHRLRLAHWELQAGRLADAESTLAQTGTVGADPRARDDLLERLRLARSSLPLEHRDGALNVTARVSGQPLRLLVDTGASTTALTRDKAAALGATPTGTRVQVRTAGGLVESEVHRLSRVEIGALELESLPVLVLEGPLPGGVDGLLGMDVLSRFPGVTGAASHPVQATRRALGTPGLAE